MDYKTQLETADWREKRRVIISRDNRHCQNCFNQQYAIQFAGAIAEFTYEKDDTNVFSLQQDPFSWVYTKKEVTENREQIFVYYAKKDETKNYVNPVAIRQVISFDFRQLKHKEKLDDLNSIKETYVRWRSHHNVDEKTARFLTASLHKLGEGQIDELVKNGFKPRMKPPEPFLFEEVPYQWLEVKNLHVHHTYYQEGLNAWDYPNESLITLCWICHENMHKDTEIEIRDKSGNKIGTRKVCSRCFGAGYFPEFSHVQHGVCFRCNGRRFDD